MIVGDFLIHLQEDGRIALHDLQTWRGNERPLRLFATLDEARVSARGELNGGRIWFSNWEAPDEIEPF